MTKLAAANDIQSYAALTAENNVIGHVMESVPMDDESMAMRMAESYAERGIDPNLALSPDSDPLSDFDIFNKN